ncbi:MAG: T9SS type A sorting domain-containing protein [Bacteroidales bacterium]|nr:T9SS type A sorting domain-containing protein [Bacteroidales bacterium]
MEKLTFLLGRFYTYVINTLILLFISLVAHAQLDQAESTMSSANLKQGYLEFTIPFYESSGYDEGIPPTDSKAGKITINGTTVCRFWSFPADGVPQSTAEWYWIRAHRTRNDVSVYIEQTYGELGNPTGWKPIFQVASSYTAGRYDQVNILENKTKSISYANIRVCLPESMLEEDLSVKVTYYIDVNNASDPGDQTFPFTTVPKLSFDMPSLTYDFANAAGKYSLKVNTNTSAGYARYLFSIDGGSTYSELINGAATVELPISDKESTRTVNVVYTLGECNTSVEKTRTIVLPAYPQATNFALQQLSNGNTSISWKSNITGLGSDPVVGDKFEIQRADNSSFTGAITIAEIDYDKSKASYSYIDNTSELNLNGTYYYRIRRTKTAQQWGWGLSTSKNIALKCTHKQVATASATLNNNNEVTITWNYTNGNVWTDGSEVIIERYNVTNGGVKEESMVATPAQIQAQKFTDVLMKMCNEYLYKIYVKPGVAAYKAQEPMSAQGKDLTPIAIGKVFSANASKGYYSDRTEITWNTDGGPIDLFAIKSRLYGSNSAFKQIGTVNASSVSTLYQYVDEKSNAGEIYEYQIIGLAQCANVTKSTDSLYTYGFRTPTGDIYGRITFENGQAVPDVEVRLESENSVMGKSIVLNAAQKAIVPHANLLHNYAEFTLQAWVAPDASAGNQTILAKPGVCQIAIKDNYAEFIYGAETLVSHTKIDELLGGSDFFHITAKATADTMYIYINGEIDSKKSIAVAPISSTANIEIGGNFAGAIDEVRIWNKALTDYEIQRDFNRYITGGESHLKAYWTFNHATEEEFYDVSYSNTTYNENHGLLQGATLSSTAIPSLTQLSYKGVTATDGSYSIRAIPYMGNGSAYTVIPKKGIHTFESSQEVRFIGAGSQSHTVNFTDKSSFKVTGFIAYEGGTIPVEGVMFKVDGIFCMNSNGTLAMTDHTGAFEIRVPVGTHEVRAEKVNHTFVNDGKITDSNGNDRNYQDDLGPLTLFDNTTIKYIGRVAGGTQQEEYALGHSLSKNNLADSIYVELLYKNPAYMVSSTPRTDTKIHALPSNKNVGKNWPKTNRVEYTETSIKIYPNEETGEFIADVFPEIYTIKVHVPGHENIPGDGEDLNVTQSFTEQVETYEYTDSVEVDTLWKKTAYIDSVTYQKSQKFIKRYTPEVRITQIDKGGKPTKFFGIDTLTTSQLDGSFTKIPIYNYSTEKYNLGYPVFVQFEQYTMQANIFEKYVYKTQSGADKENVPHDEVPTQDAEVHFINNIAAASDAQVSIEADENGVAVYKFQGGNPELTTAKHKITATITYGTGESATSIPWQQGFEAIVAGAIQTGNNFVTAGPNKLITVLRDPPGSESYSYIEKGLTHTSVETYTGSITQTGSLDLLTKAEVKTYAITGAVTPASLTGAITETVQTEEGFSVEVEHEEQYQGEDTKTFTTTFTTAFQTSSSPDDVGADADLFIGYSTNIAYGATDNVSIISSEKYGDGSLYEVYEHITPIPNDWYVVKLRGLGIANTFNTLFVYSQKHIEDILLPELEFVRNSLLTQPGMYSPEELQQICDTKDTIIVVSKFLADNPNYGKSNNDKIFNIPKEEQNSLDGPSYTVYYPSAYDKEDSKKSVSDTISYLNQTIENWKRHLEENEKAKVEAIKFDNYSFNGSNSIEYSETYSTEKEHESSFHFIIGANFTNKTGAKIFGAGAELTIKEGLSTEQGGSFTSGEEAEHKKGFVLQESGNDYLSVDVCREKNWKESDEEYNTGHHSVKDKESFSNFVFRTAAGATSCPYEGEVVAKYYEPHKHHVLNKATMRIEVPEIAVENDFIENIPSGATAYFKLYIRNNSEVKFDNWYNLKIVDEANPNGAKLYIDGAPIGNGREVKVSAGSTLEKTLEVGKGSVMNYDNLKLVLESQCEPEVSDTVIFTVHFTPSCTDVSLKKPTDKWTYNTKNPTQLTDEGVEKHFAELQIDNFDVQYDNFNFIKLQYKAAAESDEDWTTIMRYYHDTALYNAAISNGFNAEMILPSYAGVIPHKLQLDHLPDQRYDVRATSVCLINNQEFETYSTVHSGIKDMYQPRLFGNPQPANGVLNVEDNVRLDFNEPIAEGYLTHNNFQVTAIRNGAATDHSVSIQLDGKSDYLATQFEKNMAHKNFTIEMWVLADKAQNATVFSHGSANESFEVAFTNDNYIKLTIGNQEIVSAKPVPFDKGTWAHIAVTYDKEGYVSALYNFTEFISRKSITPYSGTGIFAVGKSISTSNSYFEGKVHGLRIWNSLVSSGNLQTQSLTVLSGNEPGLQSYYPMNETKGGYAADKAQGNNLFLHGCTWSNPPGKSLQFNGDGYATINTGSSAVLLESMDYTLEFWFKAEPNQTNTTLVCNGNGDGNDLGGSQHIVSVNIDENGKLNYMNNGYVVTLTNNYVDNTWHHFAVAVNRAMGKAQIYIDGALAEYFSSANLGGIIANNMYAGARVWTASTDNTVLLTDNYFKGSIDELRIWNTYKNETLVAQNAITKLDGSEMGLLAYYPFETYIEFQGVKELAFSLEDAKIQSAISPKVPDATIVNAKESTDIPPIKDKGPVSNLNFDFVVNNDALIITLKEEPQKIEKTIVTFTANRIRDLNGNENISPITWSAYINRNQLKWEEQELTITIPEFSAHEFDVTINNKSGSNQYFTIANAPEWLELSKNSGTITPLAQENITITIDEGLNVGTYNEVLYLLNENNVAEPLQLNIVVQREKPNWHVDPSDYQYSMSVYGKLLIHSSYSIDKNDILAAFKDGECIGVAHNTYFKNLDMWYTFLTVYSNQKNIRDLEFRIWDESTGTIYSAEASEHIYFANDAIFGNPESPIIFEGKEVKYANIALQSGWNWVSFNLANPNLSDVNYTLKNGSWSQNDIIKSLDFFDSYSAKQTKWIGQVSENGGLNNTSMFMIKSSENQQLSIQGTTIQTLQTPIKINPKVWNFISYLPATNLSTLNALAGYNATHGDIIKSQTSFAVFYKNNWVGDLTFLEPGKGYMLYSNTSEPRELLYPDYSMLLKSEYIKSTYNNSINYQKYATNMNIVAQFASAEYNDTVYAVVKNEKRGVNSFIGNFSGTDVQFYTISGNDDNSVIEFYTLKNGVATYANTRIPYVSNAALGTIDNPILIDFNDKIELCNVYPIPCNDELTVSFPHISDKSTVCIKISTINAVNVYSKSFTINSANSSVSIPMNSVTSGNYVITVTINDEVYTKQFIKL